MSITRIKPKTAQGRKRALDKAKTKNDSVTILSRIIVGDLATRLNTKQGAQTTLMHDVSVSKRNVNNYTKTVKTSFKVAKELISGYFKGLFRMVKVNDRVADVVFYHIAETNMVAPVINNHADATLWGGYIAVGEVDRVAAGGAAMANPSATEVATGMSDFNGKITTHSGLKEINNTATVALKNSVVETDKVIKKVWDTVGTYFDEGSESAKRNSGREYGLIYVSTVKKTFNVLVVANGTGLPIDGADVELVETGNARVTGVDGKAAIVSTITAEATLVASHALYNDNEAVVTVLETVLSYDVTIRLTLTP